MRSIRFTLIAFILLVAGAAMSVAGSKPVSQSLPMPAVLAAGQTSQLVHAANVESVLRFRQAREKLHATTYYSVTERDRDCCIPPCPPLCP